MKRLAVLIALSGLPLQSELLPIRTYTTADGLAADKVTCIVPDSRGFLWFCTPEGLSRFDGSRFVNYGVDEGLPHASANTMIETRSGEHWIGTPKGLSRIVTDGKGPRFTNYQLGPQVDANRIIALREARSGKFWIGTWDGLYEGTDPLHTRRRDFPASSQVLITDLVDDPDGNLWIGSTTGIYVYGETGVVARLTPKDGLPGDWVEMFLWDSKGRLWAALRGGLALIGRGPAGKWIVQKTYTPKTGLAGWNVAALTEASDGTLWIGTNVGISRLKTGAGQPPVFENLTRAQGLSDRTVYALAEDQAGNLWVGTEGAGVMRIAGLGFTTYREQDGLSTDRVNSVLQDRAGELVAVTETAKGRSVDVFDGARFHSVVPKAYGDDASWGGNQVLVQSRAGDWWAATKHGLCRYAPMPAENLDGRQPQACYSNNTVFRIFEDSKGGIWASSQFRAGMDELMRWDPETGAVREFPAPRIAGEPSDDLVTSFAEDRQGNIWMGLWKGGLYRYDGREFRLFQKADGVPGGTVWALLADEGGLWIGSNGGGLGRMLDTGADHPRIKTYNKAAGMASNIVLCLVKDEQGLVYAGTGQGVDRVDPRNGHIRHFSTADGLAHGEFTSAVRDRSGSLWFATRQGLSKLTPAADRLAAPPRILITDLRIGGKPYPVSQLGEERVSGLELKPSANQLQVDFVGLDYEPGDVLRYTYKLEGGDAGWSPLRSQHSVDYAALSGGGYRFLVKAVTSDGVESTVPAELDFTVLPPVWKRWWFESLAVAAAIALVFAAHRYRVAQMVSLERMRTAIATDLHDDIGASLSQIAILSEVARLGGNGHPPGEPLERVAALARDLVDSMGDIVWSIRAEPHGMDSLVRRMREFALDVLASQGIGFELQAAEAGDRNLSLQARRQLFLMFKECIHNAARHSRSTAVIAELKVAGREVVLTVEDNGTGLNSRERTAGETGGTGIPSMRQRAESLGGRMEMASKAGEGCTVTIRFPVRRTRTFV